MGIQKQKNYSKHSKLSILLNISLIISVILLSVILSTIYLFNEKQITTNNKLQKLGEKLNILNNDLTEINTIINQIHQRNKTILHDPTYKEAYNFIINDKTNENTYNDVSNNCDHFSRDVNNNAESKGIRCAFVLIKSESGLPHAIVAFNTTDEGVVYFEPQTDEIVIPEIGKDYWIECVISDSNENRNEGLIVKEIILYW